MRALRPRTEAGDRRRDHPHELAVQDLARGKTGERSDLIGRKRLAVHHAALELEQVGLAPEIGQSLRGQGHVAAVGGHEREGRGAVEHLLERVGARLVGSQLGQRVLDHAKTRAGVVEPRAQLGRLGHRDPAVVDGEDRLRILDLR